MRLAGAGRGALAAVAALTLALGACGGEEESDPTPAAETVPETTATTTAPTTTTTAPTTTTGQTTTTTGPGSGDGTGGSADPEESVPAPGESGGTGGGGDSAGNDRPPESGSPEEAFEQFCDENPRACG